MAYAKVFEKTSNSGTYLQRMYVTNVDSNAEEIIPEVLTYLRSQKPAPGVDFTCTWEPFEKKSTNPLPKGKSMCIKQMEEIDYGELRVRRNDFGEEIDPLTGFDFVEFNNGFVDMMKKKGWKLTQYYRDGFLPTREWTFYKGPLNNPQTTENL